MSVDITKIVTQLPSKVPTAVAGTLTDAWQAIMGDRVAAWRLRNAAKLQVKVKEELEKLGLAIASDRIPERYAISWFEEATKQDEPEIQELFARLLARAASGDEDALDRRHIDILSKLTPNDAIILEWLLKDFDESQGYINSDGILVYEMEYNINLFYTDLKNISKNSCEISIEHLIILGIFEKTSKIRDGDLESFVKSISRNSNHSLPIFPPKSQNRISVTLTGISLLKSLRKE